MPPTNIPQTSHKHPTNIPQTSHKHPTNIPQTSINNPLNPSGVGLVNFFGESQSRLYPHMRAKFGHGPTVVSKKGSLKFISRLGHSFLRYEGSKVGNRARFCRNSQSLGGHISHTTGPISLKFWIWCCGFPNNMHVPSFIKI